MCTCSSPYFLAVSALFFPCRRAGEVASQQAPQHCLLSKWEWGATSCLAVESTGPQMQ